MKKVLIVTALMFSISNVNADWNWGYDWWKNATISDVKRMLNNGNNIHDGYGKNESCTNWSDRTPLMLASMFSTVDIVKFFHTNNQFYSSKAQSYSHLQA